MGRCGIATLSAAGAVLAVSLIAVGVAFAAMEPKRQAVHDKLLAAAKAADAGFSGFSADRGKALFQGKHTGGKAATPSCTTCHTSDPRKTGQTRTGKSIEPMAGSVNAKRFTNPKDVEKWFRRNCGDVLGRACTAQEKGDVMLYLLSL